MAKGSRKKEVAQVKPGKARVVIVQGKALRREAPVMEPASIKVGLCDPAQVLSPTDLVEQKRALDHLARVRRDSEARAGSVKLS